MALFIVITVIFAAVVNAAALSASYPINAQLPPVARVSQPFNFVFADSTFANADSKTEYSLTDAPSWLSVDSSSRTLSGTPHSDDSGTKTFKLVASDESESDSMDVTLIVTADQGPTEGMPLIQQLPALGPVSYPSTLFIHPGRPFSISFDPDTFHNTHPSTIYYGTSPNNAPLPSWISFDPSTLTFAGNTPAFPGSESQSFTFQLLASDVAGYSAACMNFQMVIGSHILVFNETDLLYNLTRGGKFRSPNFQSLLSLDSSPISSTDLTKIDAQLPDWLSLDNDTLSLNGTPPKDAVNQNITITVTDKYLDQAKLMVRLEFLKLFLENVQGCEATIGEDFTFVFNQSIVTDNSVQLKVDLDKDLSSWLAYYPSNKTLFGHVPSDMQPQKFTIPLKAQQGDINDRQDFELDVLEPSDTNSSSKDPFSDPSPSHKKAGVIAISVVIPVVVVISLGILFCCWRRRRKSTALKDDGEFQAKLPPPRPVRPDIPNGGELGAGERTSQDGDSEEWMESITPASDLPKLKLGPAELGPAWNVASFEKPEDSMNAIPEPVPPPRSPARGGFAPLRDANAQEKSPVRISPTKNQNKMASGSGSPGLRRRTSNRSRREPLKTIQPRAMKRESVQSSRSKRYSRRSSGISTIATGLPIRLSGAGHGAGGFGPPGHGMVHMSWQSTMASFLSDENSMNNMTPYYPRPPPSTRMRHSIASSIPENPRRATSRALEREESTISEADSIEAFVQARAKFRNSNNPLFSAQISHRTTSGLRALDRNLSQRSRADTVSVSTFTDEYRQSINDRPQSTAISVSEYGDENRFSQYQPLQQPPPGLFPLMEGGQSQLSLAQDYRGVISPLPRYWSENSLSSARHGNHIKPQARENGSVIPQSSSMVSDLEQHLSRKASLQKDNVSPLQAPIQMRGMSSRGLPITSSGELAFV